MKPNAAEFAQEWIRSWNSHDLDRILSHYSIDFEITSPMIEVALGIETGTLAGNAEVRKYWKAALEKVPDLYFELKAATRGVDSIAIYYASVFGKMAIEVMFFDGDGKVNRAIAHYS
jgi:hypothetical protein